MILDAWGWCTGMTQRDGMGREEGGGRREEGSGWGTHVYLWQIHVDIWQNQYNIVKFKKKKNPSKLTQLWCYGLYGKVNGKLQESLCQGDLPVLVPMC